MPVNRFRGVAQRLAAAAFVLLTSAGLSAPQEAVVGRERVRAAVEEGDAARREGNPKAALAIFARVLEPAERAGDRALLARALVGLGWAEWATGQYDRALATRRRGLEIARELQDAAAETVLLRGIGETLYSLARYAEALEHYRLGLNAAQRANRPNEEGLILANMGSTYRSLGRFDEALAILERSVAVLRPLGSPGDLSMPLTFLGIVTRARGEYDRAIAFYTEALAAVRAEKNRRQESQILGNMGNVYLDLGRYDRAATLYRQSLAIAEEIQYTAQIGFAHGNLGSVLNIVGRPAEALKHFESALKIWRTTERRAQIGWTLNYLGILHMRERRSEAAAIAALREALHVARELNERQLEGFVLGNQGDVAFNAGRWREALERYDESLAIARAGAGPSVEYQALWGRGMALRRLGRLDEAITSLGASAAIVDDFRANVSSDSSKIAFMDTKQEVFLELAAALVEAGRVRDSFEAAEAARARALADLLNDRFLKMRAADREAFQSLREAIASKASDAAIGESFAKLRQHNRELASLVDAEALGAAEAVAIAQRLGGATIVEYLVTTDALLTWVVNPEGIRVARTPIQATSLAEYVRSAAAAAKVSPASRARGATGALTRDLQRLHELLIEPVTEWLPRDPAVPLLIIPHGPLLLLPFGMLADEAGSPLLERHTLASAPAVSVFRFMRDEPSGTRLGPALVVADPVPPADAPLERLLAAQQEGRTVQRRLGRSRVTLLTGAAASESAVKRAMGSSRLVHLATHGLVSEQRPLASSLLLAEGEGEDGYLRADEVFGLELNADLVVLSGCSTGLGRLSGDGMLGLARSFLYAGTQSLIVSYWDISDVATVYLMDRFYAALGRGLRKAAALRVAQLEARRRYPHPSYWAGFVLIGQP